MSKRQDVTTCARPRQVIRLETAGLARLPRQHFLLLCFQG